MAMTIPLPTKKINRFLISILNLFIESEKKEFSLADLTKIATACSIYDNWARTRAIEIAQELGIIKNEGSRFVIKVTSVEATQKVKNLETKGYIL